jgi:hypothetical protein
MATVEERLSALESAMEDLKLRLAGKPIPSAWFDKVAGSLEEWPEFEEVLHLGHEFRQSVIDPTGGELERN